MARSTSSRSIVALAASPASAPASLRRAGWRWRLRRPVVAVNSLEVLAAALGPQPAGTIVAALDARRGRSTCRSSIIELVALSEPRALAPDDVTLAGLPPPIRLAGNGAPLVRAALPDDLPIVHSSVGTDALGVARRARARLAAGERPVPAHTVQPLYLRPPDARLPDPPRVRAAAWDVSMLALKRNSTLTIKTGRPVRSGPPRPPPSGVLRGSLEPSRSRPPARPARRFWPDRASVRAQSFRAGWHARRRVRAVPGRAGRRRAALDRRRPRYRRRSIGSALLRESMERCRRAGAVAMFLEVATDNVSAQRLYQAFGFDEVGRRDGYYQRANGTRVSAYTMRCDLTICRCRTSSRLALSPTRTPGADPPNRQLARWPCRPANAPSACSPHSSVQMADQTSAVITKLYSALLMGFLAHLLTTARKCLRP